LRVDLAGTEIFFRQRASCGTLARVQREKRIRMQVFYSGRVQGVGFRYTVRATATGYEVAGTVANLADGRVQLIVEGAPEELESFRQAIRDSGLAHFIEHEEVTRSDARNDFRGFEIVR